jgi:hypothetical protein
MINKRSFDDEFENDIKENELKNYQAKEIMMHFPDNNSNNYRDQKFEENNNMRPQIFMNKNLRKIIEVIDESTNKCFNDILNSVIPV